MMTPRETSPYALIQEELRDEPWKLLVAVMMLNQTSAKQARPVWENFFSAYPTPEHLLLCGEDAAVQDLKIRLKPLGFQNVRSERIVKMTYQFVHFWDRKDPLHLYGIGKYGADSYNMFVKGQIVEDVEDKELKNYVRWARTRSGSGRLEDLGSSATGEQAPGETRQTSPEGVPKRSVEQSEGS